MKKLALATFLVVASIFTFISPASAATIPYFVTDSTPLTYIAPEVGITFASKEFDVNYQSGTIVLSSNPDGTGETIADDAIEVLVTGPSGFTSTFYQSYVAGQCGAPLIKIKPHDISNYFEPGVNKVRVRLLDVCGWYIWNDPVYLVNLNGPNPPASPIPTPSPPPGPAPFLDLPWNYEAKGLTFTEAALAINSFFDHEYPLLSSGLNEPNAVLDLIINYLGPPRTQESYSSHDGYDYGKQAKANINDSVLAAASGCASYIQNGAGGNTIKIDHGNGYQTRYLHLQYNGLITTQPSPCTQVAKGQQIGKIGATGRVLPPGDLGAHIHFMVVEDKNKDGNFDDNIPDGVTDPFGWQSTDPDPWPSFAFNFGGQGRTGNKSYYLWTKPISNLSDTLTSNAKFFELERYKLDFPQGSTNQNLTIEIKSSPTTKISDKIHSIGSSIVATAKDTAGKIVDTFQGLFTISVDFKNDDVSRYDPNSLAIYSSTDGINWNKEATEINWTEKTASAKLNHFSYFALFAERLDTISPTTSAILSGSQGQPNSFRSDVQVTLNAQDNAGGLGTDYIMYKVDEGDWQKYEGAILFSEEGTHTIDCYAVDKDENIEEFKTTAFTIDKKVPEAKISADQVSFKPKFSSAIDSDIVTIQDQLLATKRLVTLTDAAGNTLKVNGTYKDNGRNSTFSFVSLQYNADKLISAPKNLFTIDYTVDAQLKMNGLTQTWSENGTVKMKIFYDRKRNTSTISTLQNGRLREKEKRTSVVLLFLKTKSGNLEAGY